MPEEGSTVSSRNGQPVSERAFDRLAVEAVGVDHIAGFGVEKNDLGIGAKEDRPRGAGDQHITAELADAIQRPGAVNADGANTPLVTGKPGDPAANAARRNAAATGAVGASITGSADIAGPAAVGNHIGAAFEGATDGIAKATGTHGHTTTDQSAE